MPIPPRYPLLTEMRVENLVARDVRRVLNQTAAQISEDFAKLGKGASPLTKLQLEAQQASVTAYLRQDFKDIEKTISEGQKLAAQQASKVVSTYENQLLELVMDPKDMKALAASEARRATAGVDAALRRMSGQSYVPLSKTVYGTQKLAEGWVDDTINKALAAGWSRDRLAKELVSSISPSVPGGVSYAANRTARTEINNAFHASSNQRYADSVIVDGVDWHLSSSHPEGDICDSLASDSPYKKNQVPKKPHPHCYCFTTPALPTEDEFMENLFSGKYDPEDATWVSKVNQEKADTSYQKTNFQLGQMSLTALRKLEAEHTQRYFAFTKAWQGTAEQMYDDAAYKALNAYRIKVRDLANAKDAAMSAARKAKAAERAVAKKAAAGAADKIDALPKMSKPRELDTAYAAGKANPKGQGWFNPATGQINNNPKGTPDYDFNINCTRVAATVEMRMRGINVTAQKAGRGADKSDQAIQNNWIDPKTKRPRPLKRVESEAELTAALLKQGEGARFFVVGAWKNGGAHIWNAEIRNGRVIYHEGQAYTTNSGTTGLTNWYNSQLIWNTDSGKIGYGSLVRYMRVDDLQPTNSLVDNDWVVPAT